ncbi:MAG: hypothetical protein IJ812_07670 [Schwartzia sp.]|nr:hypothetical protein [Schwartzia sp. (in: firmicutes)]MBR1886272.1 hypothetical protein [Schwartzia sp. (in: firmicutes)]
MNKVLGGLLLAWVLLVSRVSAANLEDHPTAAVMDFGIHEGAAASDTNIQGAGKAAAEYVIHRLIHDGHFLIAERDLARKQMDEERLKTVGLIDPDSAKRIGEILKVHYVIYGNVNDVAFSETGAGIDMSIVGGVNIGTVSSHIIARIMDVNTGTILMAAKGEGKSKSSYVFAGTKHIGVINIGTKIVTQDSVHNAIQKAAFQAVDVLMERLYGKEKVKGKEVDE